MANACGGQWSFVHDIGDWRIGNHATVPVVFPVDRHWREARQQGATGADMVRMDKGILRIEIGGGDPAWTKYRARL